MIKSYLKIALRTLRKNRLFTVINIVGLSVGIAAALLIFRLANYELSFNKQFADYDSVVRVVGVVESPERGREFNVCTPLPAMDAIEETISQFSHTSRVREVWAAVTVPNPSGGAPLKKFNVPRGQTAFFVEKHFPSIFSFDWLSGDPTNVLGELGEIVLTKTLAEKCFDQWELAMDQTILLDNLVPVIVKGVIEDPPSNCDFSFPYLVSFETVKANADLFFYGGGWGSCSSNNQMYARLSQPGLFEAADLAVREIGKEEYADRNRNSVRHHVLQPLSDLHHSEDYYNSGSHRTSKSRLRVLSAIGILILIMACFNFINLTTAQSTLRAKEVGVRKTLGSSRNQLTLQFLSETILIVGAAIFLSAVLATAVAPLLKHVSDVPDSLPFLSDPRVLTFLLATGIIVTILAGLYPAVLLSGFKPVNALKSQPSQASMSGGGLRKSLVVLQFAIAQGLIIAALVNILQLDYIRNRDLGFDQSLVYTFGFNSDSLSIARQAALKNNLKQIPQVKSVSLSSDQPFSGNTWATNFNYATRPDDEPYAITQKFCDHDYMETYSLELLAGRFLHPSDTVREAVVNETLMEKLAIVDPNEMVGQNLTLGQSLEVRIVGVLKDFHAHSLHEEKKPLMMTTYKDYYWEAGVKITSGNLATTTGAIEKVFDEVFPEQVFSGRFLDENIAQFYEDDRRLSATTKGFGFLAILISCLGLFGLAAHAAAQRVKEIGIRKVLGASVAHILGLLSRDFLKLIVIALVIASPLAAYFMSDWLDNFVYRIELPWWVFLATGFTALAIALGTVSYQSLRAAFASPIESLRDE